MLLKGLADATRRPVRVQAVSEGGLVDAKGVALGNAKGGAGTVELPVSRWAVAAGVTWKGAAPLGAVRLG